jgi:hypothetical protein
MLPELSGGSAECQVLSEDNLNILISEGAYCFARMTL